MTYKSLEHSIRSIMESSRRDIKAVARPEDNRKEVENTPRQDTPRESSAYTRMQEIQKKIVDEDYTLEEIEELENLINEKKKTKKDNIKSDEPDVPGGFTVGTRMATGVNSSPSLATEEVEEVDEAAYSAKAARAGKDIGKPGKQFAKIAASAAEKYGSKEKGEKVAGAVLAKIRAKNEEVEQVDEISRDLARKVIKKASDEKNLGYGKKDRTKAVELAGKKAYSIPSEPKVRATEETEVVEFSEAELAYFQDVLEGRRGRPPKNQEESPESKGSLVAQLRDSKPMTNPQTGRDEHEVNLGNKKVKVSTKHAQTFLSAHGAAKTAADKDKVEKDFRAKISEDLEQVDEWSGTIKKAATSSQMMSKATQAQGKLQQKQTTSLVKQKLDAQKRELLRRQQTAQTAAQRSAIKT